MGEKHAKLHESEYWMPSVFNFCFLSLYVLWHIAIDMKSKLKNLYGEYEKNPTHLQKNINTNDTNNTFS